MRIFLFLIAVVSSMAFGNDYSKNDAWYNEIEISERNNFVHKMIFYETPHSLHDPLIEEGRLSNESFVITHPTEIHWYLGADKYINKFKYVLLVRGLFQSGGAGRFTIRSDDKGNLWVHHGSLGVRDTPLKKTEIYVFTDKIPEVVYVTARTEAE